MLTVSYSRIWSVKSGSSNPNSLTQHTQQCRKSESVSAAAVPLLIIHTQKSHTNTSFAYRVSHKRRPIGKILKVDILNYFNFLIITELIRNIFDLWETVVFYFWETLLVFSLSLYLRKISLKFYASEIYSYV